MVAARGWGDGDMGVSVQWVQSSSHARWKVLEICCPMVVCCKLQNVLRVDFMLRVFFYHNKEKNEWYYNDFIPKFKPEISFLQLPILQQTTECYSVSKPPQSQMFLFSSRGTDRVWKKVNVTQTKQKERTWTIPRSLGITNLEKLEVSKKWTLKKKKVFT